MKQEVFKIYFEINGKKLRSANYIEKMGTGINKIKNLMLNAGLEEPKYKFDAFFTVTFKRPSAKSGGTSGGITGGIKDRLSERMLIILKTISDNVNISYLENKLNIPKRPGRLQYTYSPVISLYLQHV